MDFDCPLPAALEIIPDIGCGFRFDQIQKLGLQRRGNSFATEAALKTLATWTALLNEAVSGDTRITVTPYFDSLVIPNSEGQFQGGNDNTTLNGIREYRGEGSVVVTGRFTNLPPEVYEALDKYSQESITNGSTNLMIFPFTMHGKIISKAGSGTTRVGIPVYNFRRATLGSEGFNSPNTFPFSFDLASDWDQGLLISEPTDFNPLLDLHS